jgi:putative transposase
MRSVSHWRLPLDNVFAKTNGELHYLWWAVDHEGEVPERFVSKRRDKKAAFETLEEIAETPSPHR